MSLSLSVSHAVACDGSLPGCVGTVRRPETTKNRTSEYFSNRLQILRGMRPTLADMLNIEHAFVHQDTNIISTASEVDRADYCSCRHLRR
jgi:hypothetical protein